MKKMIKYKQSGKVDDIIDDNPDKQKGEESVHKMFLEHIFVVNNILIYSQKLEDV